MSARIRLPLQPRLLSKELAAAYCGLSVPIFETECPVVPIRVRRRVLFDRVLIDQWIDSRSTDQVELRSGKDWLGLLENADGQAHCGD